MTDVSAKGEAKGTKMTPDQKILASMTGFDKALHLAGVEGADRVPAIGAAEELATRMGVTRQAIHFFKKQGWVPRDRAQQISRLYGIPLCELERRATK